MQAAARLAAAFHLSWIVVMVLMGCDDLFQYFVSVVIVVLNSCLAGAATTIAASCIGL